MRHITSIVLATLLLSAPVHGDWPQILGPDRSGRTAEELPKAFPEGGPEVLWRHTVGEGMAGVAVAGERVVVFHRPGKVERAEALSTKDGSTLWRSETPATYRGGILPDSGPRAVPTIHGDSVVTLGAGGRLRILKLGDGTERWSVDLAGTFKAPEGYFGFGGSPLVVEAGERALVVVNVGGDGAGMVAFELETGKIAWRVGDDRASYSSPISTTLGRQPQIVAATRLHTVGLDPKSGGELWRVPFGRRGPSVVAAVPVSAGGRLLLTAAYGVGARLLDFSTDLPKAEPTVIWSGDQLSSHYPTPVVVGGSIFGVSGREDHGDGELRAFAFETGKVLWSEKGYGLAHLLTDGKRLLAQRLDGSLDLLAADPARFRRLDRAAVAPSPLRAQPAFARGVLYLRTTPDRGSGEVMAVQLR